MNDMTFSEALDALKGGVCIARRGWNGQGMYLYLVSSSEFYVSRAPLNRILPEGERVNYRAHIDMRTAQGDHVPWVASQSDLLAEDWITVDTK
jgi:hypothetical protein